MENTEVSNRRSFEIRVVSYTDETLFEIEGLYFDSLSAYPEFQDG